MINQFDLEAASGRCDMPAGTIVACWADMERSRTTQCNRRAATPIGLCDPCYEQIRETDG